MSVTPAIAFEVTFTNMQMKTTITTTSYEENHDNQGKPHEPPQLKIL